MPCLADYDMIVPFMMKIALKIALIISLCTVGLHNMHFSTAKQPTAGFVLIAFNCGLSQIHRANISYKYKG